MMVVACVAIIIVGPKDLPAMLRTFGKTVSNIRRLAGDFQRQFSDALKETELDDIKKDISGSSTFQPLADAKKAMEDYQKEFKEGVTDTVTTTESAPKTSDKPAQAKATKSVARKSAGKKGTTKSARPKASVAKKPATTTSKSAKTAVNSSTAKRAPKAPTTTKPAARKRVKSTQSGSAA